MTTLILTASDPGAGHLKQAKRADRVHSFNHRLVIGPVPVDGPAESFFLRRRAIYEAEALFHEPWWFAAEHAEDEQPHVRRIWSTLPELCLAFDRVELWIDPDPNSQLQLLQLLDWLGHIPAIAPRLWLKQADSPLGERRPGDWALPPVRVEPDDVALARRAWTAFGSPTPEAWAALQDDPDLPRLPGLRRAIEQMLEDLPDRTGLGASARRLLDLVERQGHWIEAAERGHDVSDRHLDEAERCFLPLMHRVLQWGSRLPLWHFELGETLCDLGTARCPAIAGVTEVRFSLEMHGDKERHRRFNSSPLSLTVLGHRLVAREDDWSRHNRVHRWWGGTRLTNKSLWRWDAEENRLLEPSFLSGCARSRR